MTYVSLITRNSSSCHDLIISAKSFVLYPNLSDRLFISTLFDRTIDDRLILTRLRDFSSSNVVRFSSIIHHEFSSFNVPLHDINIYACQLERFIYDLSNEYFSIKLKTLSIKRNLTETTIEYYN